MKVYVENNGRIAEAHFNIYIWSDLENNWIDETNELEDNVLENHMFTQGEYEEFVDFWKNEARTCEEEYDVLYTRTESLEYAEGEEVIYMEEDGLEEMAYATVEAYGEIASLTGAEVSEAIEEVKETFEKALKELGYVIEYKGWIYEDDIPSDEGYRALDMAERITDRIIYEQAHGGKNAWIA